MISAAEALQRLRDGNARFAASAAHTGAVADPARRAALVDNQEPFAIVLDALSFLASALLLRRLSVPNDVPGAEARRSIGAEIREGLALVWNNRTLRSLALVAGAWQVLHHMQIAVLILFATRDLGLSAGALGMAYMAGGLGCVFAATFAERLARRFGVGPLIVYGLLLTAFGWQVFGLTRGTGGAATVALGLGMLLFDFGAVLWGINYLSLRQAITPDRLLGRMTATMRFLAVAAAPLGSLVGGVLATGIGLRQTLWVVGALGMVLALVAMRWSPVRRHRQLPAVVLD